MGAIYRQYTKYECCDMKGDMRHRENQEMAVARKRLNEFVSSPTDTHTTIEELEFVRGLRPQSFVQVCQLHDYD
jgi:hypothetical protein